MESSGFDSKTPLKSSEHHIFGARKPARNRPLRSPAAVSFAAQLIQQFYGSAAILLIVMNPQSLFVSQGIGAAHGRFHAKLEIVFSPHLNATDTRSVCWRLVARMRPIRIKYYE
jgi:hypothetical protein